MKIQVTLGGLLLVIALTSTPARADDPVSEYVDQRGEAVCEMLGLRSAFADAPQTVEATMIEVTESGLSLDQAGEVIARSVTKLCPQYIPLVQDAKAQAS